ncbi:hypothetical protein Fleli_2668 [Bernardetia litoralis DSM 6794]|uniref:STAS/SEC14 domain-containing protein n=1 Tax=Bernardetia litoralis (strain ATCC 23117 / DSM 6794 / NBRC 15988 / NCIMB 1366 / Fx l1 / Sio-4) TaxID=880071 RepID=I4AM40_BERLS|nr:hypothetical protein [Bernardetia litoralis]AFM05025.1 hypothetical protein Fleli_2668 [Bernardetia litoralis DSM 6794]
MKHELKDENQDIFCQVEFLADKQIIYSKWICDGITVNQIQKGAMIMLQQLKDNKVSYVLNDNRELIGAWDEANDWIAKEWIPKAVEIGLKKFAHIISDDLFSHLSAEFMEDNMNTLQNEFQMRLFNSYEDAINWLQE